MDYQYILIDVKDRIATVTINRPEYSNAFARESYYEIADAMNTLGARDDVGVIVIKDLLKSRRYRSSQRYANIHPQLPEACDRYDKRCRNRRRIKLRPCLRFPYRRTIQ